MALKKTDGKPVRLFKTAKRSTIGKRELVNLFFHGGEECKPSTLTTIYFPHYSSSFSLFLQILSLIIRAAFLLYCFLSLLRYFHLLPFSSLNCIRVITLIDAPLLCSICSDSGSSISRSPALVVTHALVLIPQPRQNTKAFDCFAPECSPS